MGQEEAFWLKILPGLIRLKLEKHATLQKIIGNISWLFFDQAMRMGVGLFIGIWMARYLGPEQFGLLSYATAFVSIFGALSVLGLDGIVVRDIVRDPSSKDQIIGTAFVLMATGGVVVWGAAMTAIFLLRPQDQLVHWLVGIIAAGTIFQAFNVIDFWFQSQVQAKFTVVPRNVSFIIIVLVKIILLVRHAPLIAFAWAGLADIILGTMGLIITYRLQGNLLRAWKPKIAQARALLSNSWPLIISAVAIYVQARIDQVMIGSMIGDYELGQYSVAMRLIEAFGFIPMIVYSSVAPSVTKAKKRGDDFYYERLLNIYRLIFILFILIATPIFLFSHEIVVILFGGKYNEAGMLLSLFAMRLFFTNFGVARNLFIVNDNLFQYWLVVSVVGALLNISLNYLLIPKFMSVGAILATIISFSITIFVLDMFYTKTRRNLKMIILGIFTPWKLSFK